MAKNTDSAEHKASMLPTLWNALKQASSGDALASDQHVLLTSMIANRDDARLVADAILEQVHSADAHGVNTSAEADAAEIIVRLILNFGLRFADDRAVRA